MLSYPEFQEKTVVMVFTTQGQKFSFLNDNLIVKNNDDEVILQTTCHRMLALWIVGSGTFTTGLLERSKKFGFPILYLSQNLKLIGAWNAPTEGNFLLRKKQYIYEGLTIAKHIIKNKIYNQQAILKTIRKKNELCKIAIDNLNQYQMEIDKLDNLTSLLGIEGVASKVYFGVWFETLNWEGRKPRVKHNPLNLLLDLGYTYLFYFVENMLHLYGFDVYKGVYHTNFYKRKSLVCDIVEPFRCIIDKAIKNAYGLGQVKEDDFTLLKGQYSLSYARSKHYSRIFLKAILEYKADIFLYCQQYYRVFIQQKDINQYPIFNIDNPKQ
jgi:CRISPR-associated protein Cas1